MSVMASCPQVGIADAALWRAGAVATPVLCLLSQDELRHAMALRRLLTAGGST